MTEITWMKGFIPQIVNDPTFIPFNIKSVLDVGCGKGILGAILRNYRTVNRLVGIDVFEPCIEHARRHYDEVLCIDIAGQRLPFDDDTFDFIGCLSTIEHFSHDDALTLLQEMTRIGKHVLVTTPTYFMPQGVLDDNPYQVHMCSVSKKDFESLGYRVRGTGKFRMPYLGISLPIQSWMLGSLIPSWHTSYLSVWPSEGRTYE